MSRWVISGLGTGVCTTDYPLEPDNAPGVSPGLPRAEDGTGDLASLIESCPTGALSREGGRLSFDARRCVHCYRCARGAHPPVSWDRGYEWASGKATLGRAFARSIHIRVVDAGDCGACLREVKQLTGPYYNLHRLGFFITPTPRQADVLVVVGAGTEQMHEALLKTYNAMPAPRAVIAVGTCALSGGVFGPSFTCSDGIGSILPVDVEVPGNPPPPLAILHGLLLATGRASARPREPR